MLIPITDKGKKLNSPVIGENNNSSSLNLILDQNEPPTTLRILRHDIISSGREFDPYKPVFIDDQRIFSLLYSSLVKYDPVKKIFIPHLAKEWFVSDDSKRWIFFLRDDVFFHDGSRFDASIVKFTFERLFLNNNSAYLNSEDRPLSTNLDTDLSTKIESIEINDRFRITFRLKESYAAFLSILPDYFMLTPNSFSNGELLNPIGTGPYIFNNDVSNATFEEFTRWDNYFEGLAPFDRIHSFAIDFSIAIRDKLIDIWTFDFGNNIDFDYYQFNISEVETSFWFLYLNFDNEFFKNKKVRQGLEYAFNQQEHIENFRYPEGYLASASTDMYFEENPYVEIDPTSKYDLELADQLLTEAGYPLSVREEIVLDFIDWGGLYGITDFIVTSFANLGIEVNVIVPGSNEETWKKMQNGDFDISYLAVIQSGGFDPAEFELLLKTDGNLNFGGYSNETVDNLLELGETTPVRQERSFYYKHLQEVIREEQPYITMRHMRFWYYTAKNIVDLVKMNYEFQFEFKYSKSESFLKLSQTDTHNLITSSLEISDDPIYFWKQDSVVESLNDEILDISLEITKETSSTTASRHLKIKTDNQDLAYQIKLYYDKSEEFDNIEVRILDPDRGSSGRVNIIAFDTDLQFLQLELKGDLTLVIEPILGDRTDQPLIEPQNDIRYANFVYLTGMTAILIILVIQFVRSTIRFSKLRRRKAKFWSTYSMFLPQIYKYISLILFFIGAMLGSLLGLHFLLSGGLI